MMTRGGPRELAPLVVSITRFEGNVPIEDAAVRKALDDGLEASGKQSSHTVANTIFPESLWNPKQPRKVLFERYKMSLPRLRKASKKNRHGLYFQRLIEGGPPGHENQLEFIIGQYEARKAVRRSALQVAVFDAKLDLTNAALRGFPCLQHVTFTPTQAGLQVNAFYATQYAFERAYGNYLGLCGLGRLVAHEFRIPLVRVTCFTGIMMRDQDVKTAALKPVAKAVDTALQKETDQ
jgi:hypothetical protein